MRNILRTDTAGGANAQTDVTNIPDAPVKPVNTPAYTLPSDIPKNYDDTYVRAIPKDPQSAFVYWERPKEVTRECVFPDKGTAHVGNDEAGRVYHQLGHDVNHNWQQGNNNAQWLNDNNRWLNNTKPWDGGGNHGHGGDGHGRHPTADAGQMPLSAKNGVLESMLDNLIAQCGQYIADSKRRGQYVPIPSSGEIYKANSEKRR
ncbi:MAG: DUF4912 domain-containing protein [Chitinispirillia bacterium]|nr:DUF4912 domain-containing protein [Chitinispirillia bacterium]